MFFVSEKALYLYLKLIFLNGSNLFQKKYYPSEKNIIVYIKYMSSKFFLVKSK